MTERSGALFWIQEFGVSSMWVLRSKWQTCWQIFMKFCFQVPYFVKWWNFKCVRFYTNFISMVAYIFSKTHRKLKEVYSLWVLRWLAIYTTWTLTQYQVQSRQRVQTVRTLFDPVTLGMSPVDFLCLGPAGMSPWQYSPTPWSSESVHADLTKHNLRVGLEEVH